MKAISTARRFASILALLLSVVMLFAACGGDEVVSSGENTADDTSSSVVSDEVSDTADEEISSEETADVSDEDQDLDQNENEDLNQDDGEAQQQQGQKPSQQQQQGQKPSQQQGQKPSQQQGQSANQQQQGQSANQQQQQQKDDDETKDNEPQQTTPDEDNEPQQTTPDREDDEPQQTTPPSSTGIDFSDGNEANIWNNIPTKDSVHVLMWRKYTKTEQKLVDQYQKMTGVKIVTTITTEKEYPTKLVSMVSGKNSPDVVCFSAGNFPGLVTKSLQPLSSKAFNLDADCWNKNYMDAYKINDRYFGVAMPASWSCEDCTYVTYYNPAVLKACGVTTTPYQLYQQGKWNWDEQTKIVRQVANANRGYTGLALQSTDLFMLSAGVDFASYNGSQFTNNLGSVQSGSLLTKAWQVAAELNADKILGGWELSLVQQGKVGLFSAISYGLYNEGAWFDNVVGGYQNLQAVPMAGPKGGAAYTPVRPKCWGVPKGAKNPTGAAYFLRYFLDTSAFDQSTTFYNKQFETVYKEITKSSAKKAVMHGWGVSDYVESGTYSSICSALVNSTPANVNTTLNARKGSVQTGISRANKDLARIK